MHRLLLGLTAAATLLAAAPAHAQGTPRCGATVTTIAADGTRDRISVADGVRVPLPTPGDRLSFQPQALTSIGGAGGDGGGGDGGGFTNELAVRPGGGVISVYRRTATQPDDSTVVTAVRERRVAGGWDDTRAIATAQRHIIRLDGRRLLRHRYSPDGAGGSASLHFEVGAAEVVAARGFKPYRTLVTVPGPRTRTTLLATTTAGALREVVLDERRGRVVSDRRLATGFRGARAISTGYCEPGEDRPLLVHTRAGELRLYSLAPGGVTGGDVIATGVTAAVFR